MARSFARITTSIWRDDDFTGITAGQQGVYFMLDSQADVSAVGTLPLRLRRWAKNSKGMTGPKLRRELTVLEDAGHIVIDEDTEELLLRTFVKWDGGYQNSLRLHAIRDAALDIASPIIRKALALELEKLGLSDIASQALSGSRTDSPTKGASDSPTEGTSNGRRLSSNLRKETQPTTRNPQPLASPKGAAEDPAKPHRRDELFEAVAEACGIDWRNLTGSGRGSLIGAVKQLRDVEATPGQVAVRARRYRERFRQAALTPPALAKHWASLADVERPAAPRDPLASARPR